MTSYRLLRSNKESGPYTLHDLVNFGLKPYDLVWADGKSAAWRYPSELDELKPYAPPVEEQPYDRFFKKNTPVQEAVITQQPVQQKPVVVHTPVIEDKPVFEEKPLVVHTPVIEDKPVFEEKPLVQEPAFIEEKYEKYIPKKSVFVTMPGQKTMVAQKPAEPAPIPSAPAATITVKENPAAQIKYSQPLDEIKEMYVKTLQDRKTKIARKSFLLVNLKRASIIVGLVALGVVAGLVINRGSERITLPSQVPSSSVITNNKQEAVQDPVTAPDQQLDRVAKNELPDVDQSGSQPINLSPKVKERLLREEKQDVITEPRITHKETVSKPPVVVPEKRQQQARPVDTDPRTGERNRAVRTDEPEEDRPVAKAVLKKNNTTLGSLVSVKSNDYTRVAFGGIRNLELTVTNDSKYILDKVTVELQYLKPSEEPLRTELIQFHSVAPNGTMTMRIRDTNRGIKVSYKILEVQSAQTETALSGF